MATDRLLAAARGRGKASIEKQVAAQMAWALGGTAVPLYTLPLQIQYQVILTLPSQKLISHMIM